MLAVFIALFVVLFSEFSSYIFKYCNFILSVVQVHTMMYGIAFVVTERI